MPDWVANALRFAVYADLLILFGVVAWPFHARAARSLTPSGRVAAGFAALGALVSALAFWAQLAAISGAGAFAIDRDTAAFVVGDTPMGVAFLIRTAALGAAAILLWLDRWRVAALALTGVACVTLAWAGHAAATEGGAGTLHRLSDSGHLLAAGLWLGALVILARRLFRPLGADTDIASSVAALRGFAATGTAIVMTILATGAVNLWAIIGIDGLRTLPTTLWGLLFGAKIALFGAMLILAALNRWQLTPRIEAARRNGDMTTAARAIRTSIALELASALAILAVVAWLGTLDPTARL